jgi:broad specificity phosphatase PhoE
MNRAVRIWWSMIGTLVLLLGAATTAAAQRTATTTVIVVRHAEKEATPPDDPPLSAAGQARARALLDALRDAGVNAVITTQFARTRQTAAPLATALHLTPQIVATPSPTNMQAVAAAVRRHAGGVVLVVGHGNTVPAIVAALGAKQPPPICDAEYDALFVVTVPAHGKATVVKARYGAASPVTATCGAMK